MKNILFVIFIFIFSCELIGCEKNLFVAAKDDNEKLFKELWLSPSSIMEKKENILFVESMRACPIELKEEEIDELLSFLINDEEIKSTMHSYRYEIIDGDLVNRLKDALKNYTGQEKDKDNFNLIKKYSSVKRINISRDKSNPEWRSLLSFAITYGNYDSMKLLLETTHGQAASYLQENECYYNENIFEKQLTCTEQIIELLFSYHLFSLVQQVYLHGCIHVYDEPSPIQNELKKMLENESVNINEPMFGGTSPLIYVLQKRNKISMGEYLLGLDTINVACVDPKKYTPLHWAVEMLFKPVPNRANEVIYCAVQKQYVPIIKKLLEKKASIMATDERGNTVIYKFLVLATPTLLPKMGEEGTEIFDSNKKVEYQNRRDIFDLLASAMEYEDSSVTHRQEEKIARLFDEFSYQYDWATADTNEKFTGENMSFFAKPIVKIVSALIFFSGMGFVLYNFLYGQQLVIA